MFKVGQVVFKAGAHTHPNNIRAGTKGVITGTPSRYKQYFLVKYEDSRPRGVPLVGWHCTEKEFYTLGNRFTEQIEEVMCFPDGVSAGTFGGALHSVSDILGVDLFYPHWWDGDNDEKVSIITLLSIVDDETMDAIIQKLK